MRLAQEEVGKVLLVRISAAKEGSHVNVGDVELKLDVAADGSLTVRTVALERMQ